MTNKKFSPNQEQEKFILKNYKGTGNLELTNMFNLEFDENISVRQMKSYKGRNKLDSGLTGRFEKGQKSFNKGLKWDDFISKEGQANSLKTTFKKGNKPKNTRPIGSTWIDKDGYLYVKVRDKGKRFGRKGMWQPYHHLVWIAEKGEIPEGYMIIFLDRDRSNFDINNLAMVTQAEKMRIQHNENYGYDKDINLSLVNLAKLIDKYQRIIKGE